MIGRSFAKVQFDAYFPEKILDSLAKNIDFGIWGDRVRSIRKRMKDIDIDPKGSSAFDTFVLDSVEREGDPNDGRKLFELDCGWRHFSEKFLACFHSDLDTIQLRTCFLEEHPDYFRIPQKSILSIIKDGVTNSRGVVSYYRSCIPEWDETKVYKEPLLLIHGSEFELLQKTGVGITGVGQTRRTLNKHFDFPMPFILQRDFLQSAIERSLPKISESEFPKSKKFLEGLLAM